MKKVISRYIYFFALGTSLLTLLFFLITNYVITLTAPSFPILLLIFCLSSAILAAILTFGLSVFDPIILEALVIAERLHRFENLGNPLLLELSTKAPGTYHHSLNVSNMSSKAAKAIGADSLLVRTASFYHDIGKLKNPQIFIENQGKPGLTELAPQDDFQKYAGLIVAHIEEGVKIARKFQMPEDLIDLISQHHGTTMVSFFYDQAKKNGLKVKRSDFRYPGPRPHSKEAAILMLADSTEAAIRAQPAITAKSIQDTVSSIISERLLDNQFPESLLSRNEIALIKESFIRTLQSIHHQRVDYSKK